MDKNNIIEEILNEWAMRSPDGLVGGHDTSENMAVFEDLLLECGLVEDEVCELMEQLFGEVGRPKGSFNKKFMQPDKKSPTGWSAINHKKVKDGTPVPAPVISDKAKAALPLTAQERAGRDIWEDFAAPNGKNVGDAKARIVKQAVEKFDASGAFISMYNQLSLLRGKNGFPSAIEVYGDTNFTELINKVDEYVPKGLGRGELIFTFLLADFKSGGTRDTDLLYTTAEGNVEMKELTGKAMNDLVRISTPTLKNFGMTEFKGAIDELADAIRRDPPWFGRFLVRALRGYDAKNKPIYPYTGAMATKQQITRLENFTKNLRTTEMPAKLFNALAILGEKFAIAHGKKPPAGKALNARAAIKIDAEKEEFKIKNPNDVKRDMAVVASDPDTEHTIKMAVVPSAENGSDASYGEIAAELKYFKKRYNQRKISKELNALIERKYSGILVIDKRDKNSAKFVPSDSDFTFIGLNLNGILIALPKETGAAQLGDDDIETKD